MLKEFNVIKNPVNQACYRNKTRLLVLSLLVTFLVFFPSLFNGFFCWDDKEVPLAPFVQHLTLLNLGKYFSTFHAGLYHPITTLSFALDYWIGNGKPFPFHFTNLILHLANTFLLFLFVSKLFRSTALAFLVALFFGIHPMHVEAVAWITSRKDLLYVFFFLGSLISYTQYIEGRKKVYYYLSLLLFLFSCLSKIQGAVLPVALILIDFLRDRKLISKLVVAEKVPFFIIALIFGVINIFAQKGYGYIDYKAPYLVTERLIIFCYGFAQYIFRIGIPWHISVFYPYPFHPGESISLIYYFYPVFLILFVAVLIYCLVRSKKTLVFGLGFYFLCIFLVLIINNYRETIITDRYTYLGSAGFFIFIFSITLTLFRHLKRFVWILPAFVCGAAGLFSYQTFERNRLWHSPSELMESARLYYPDSPVLLNTLGSLAIDSGSYMKAITYLDQAIATDPHFTYAWYHKGMAESKVERFPEALGNFSQAIRLNPAFTDAYFGRGNVYRATGDNEKALIEYSIVLQQNRNYFGAWQDRAIVKGNLGDFRGAIDDLGQAIKLDPDFGASYYLRGIAKFELRISGCDDLRKALLLGYQPSQKALDYYCK